jgi:hypothetical protein
MIGCNNNQTASVNGACVSGKCRDYHDACDLMCNGFGAACAGIAYLPCQH